MVDVLFMSTTSHTWLFTRQASKNTDIRITPNTQVDTRLCSQQPHMFFTAIHYFVLLSFPFYLNFQFISHDLPAVKSYLTLWYWYALCSLIKYLSGVQESTTPTEYKLTAHMHVCPASCAEKLLFIRVISGGEVHTVQPP